MTFRIKFTNPANPQGEPWSWKLPNEILIFLPVIDCSFGGFSEGRKRLFEYTDKTTKKAAAYYFALCQERYRRVKDDENLEMNQNSQNFQNVNSRDFLPLTSRMWADVIKMASFFGDEGFHEDPEIMLPSLHDIAENYLDVSHCEAMSVIINEYLDDVFRCKCDQDKDAVKSWFAGMEESEKNKYKNTAVILRLALKKDHYYSLREKIYNYSQRTHQDIDDQIITKKMKSRIKFINETREYYPYFESRIDEFYYWDEMTLNAKLMISHKLKPQKKCNCGQIIGDKWLRFVTEFPVIAETVWDNCDRVELLEFTKLPAKKVNSMKKKEFSRLPGFISSTMMNNKKYSLEDEKSKDLYQKYEDIISDWRYSQEEADLAYIAYQRYIVDKIKEQQKKESRERSEQWKQGLVITHRRANQVIYGKK